MLFCVFVGGFLWGFTVVKGQANKELFNLLKIIYKSWKLRRQARLTVKNSKKSLRLQTSSLSRICCHSFYFFCYRDLSWMFQKHMPYLPFSIFWSAFTFSTGLGYVPEPWNQCDVWLHCTYANKSKGTQLQDFFKIKIQFLIIKIS